MKAALMTLGCKVNQADTTVLAAILKEVGYQITSWDEKADLYLINTCTVTSCTDQQSRKAIRQAVRRNPSALIIATGCYAQIDPSAIARIGGVDLVLGNREKFDLRSYLQTTAKDSSPRIFVTDISQNKVFQGLSLPKYAGRTRAFLKVQDGCNGECAYCVVPFARGPGRSLPPEEVKRQVKDLLAQGFSEIVLTGIRLGAYGQDLRGEISLSDLLRDLLPRSGLWRLRLSSLEPQDFSPKLISALRESPRLCRHLHLPLQSGDDEILALMGRTYSTQDYRSLLQGLANDLPGIGLGTDVIVGFPGETEEHFLRTYRFLEAIPLSYIHVFPYSPRPGTAAATFTPAIPPPEKRDRTRRLLSLAREKSLRFRAGFIGKRLEVIVLRKKDRQNKRWWALSDNFLPILVQDEVEEVAGQLITAEVEGMEQGVLLGRWKR